MARLAFVSFLFALVLSAQAQELPLKTIELEWEPVENAFGYELRLTPKNGGTPLTFKVLENKFVQDVPIGNYIFRIRSRHKDAEDHWSAWSDPILIEVLTKELLPLEPAHEAVLSAQTEARETVTFAWNQIDKARDYVLKIWTEETKDKPMTFVTRKNTHRLKLLPGRVYFWQVTFESSTGVAYTQEVRTQMFSLQGPKLLQPSIVPVENVADVRELKWIKSPKAKTYKARLQFRYLDETEWKTILEGELAETKWSFEKLKAGQYRAEVIAKAPRHAESVPGTYEFTVKPTEAEILQALQ